jgi:hypothetical protein
MPFYYYKQAESKSIRDQHEGPLLSPMRGISNKPGVLHVGRNAVGKNEDLKQHSIVNRPLERKK